MKRFVCTVRMFYWGPNSGPALCLVTLTVGCVTLGVQCLWLGEE